MNPPARIIEIVAIIVLAAAVIGRRVWLGVRSRRKSAEEVERLRRLDVNRCGRITTGQIVDLVESAAAPTPRRFVLYHYEVAGVTYEASQDVTTLPETFSEAHGSVDQPANVKYDPKRPANSIIVCEEWRGIGQRGAGSGIRDSRFGAQATGQGEASQDG